MRTMTQNKRGEWVPAIPFPLFGPRRKCLRCGTKFWTMDGYRGHYALKHIVDPPAPVKCGGDGCLGCPDCKRETSTPNERAKPRVER